MADTNEFDFEGKNLPKKGKNEREPDLVTEMIDMFNGPIIVSSTEWASTIPQDLKDTIPIERMLAYMKHEKTATIPEVVAYMMPLTLEKPILSQKWVNIYTWCASQYAKEYKGIDLADQNIAPAELSADEQQELQRLRDFIYEKRRKHVQERLKKIKRNKSKDQDKER